MLFLNLILAGTLIWLACKYLDLKKSLNPKEKRFSQLVDALSDLSDRVEDYEGSHSKEISDFAIQIAQKTSMNEEQQESLAIAAKLHDIGMLLVTNEVIKSRRKLNDDDAFIMKNHPLLAEHYLKQHVDVRDDIPSIIRWHHERWDGFGYPDSLRGEQIPLPSRILSIADAVSSMKSVRHYRKKHYKTNKEIIAELQRQSGLQFDPSLVKITISLLTAESNG